MRSVTCEPYGILPDGRRVQRWTLRRERLELQVLEYGAIVTRLRVPDRHGTSGDVVLGFDTLGEYLKDRAYHGAVVGPCAGRIGRARFELEEEFWPLERNDGLHHLHGGSAGFHRQVWRALPLLDDVGVELTHRGVEGAAGYPGAVEARVRYVLLEGGIVRIDFAATVSRPTPVNLAQHAYFDLAGGAASDVLGHRVRVAAAAYLPLDRTLIPTGEICPVAATPFDLRAGVVLRDAVGGPVPGGFDHAFVLEGPPGMPRMVAEVMEPESGRRLEVVTTEPVLVLYTGNFLDGSTSARGRDLGRHAGLCLEAQRFPDAVNQPKFPGVIVRPGERYEARTEWRFSAA
jgi:aldose 1-epimerase